MSDWTDVWRRAFESLGELSANMLPRVAVAVLMLIVGLLVALALQAIVRTVLRRSGVDRLVLQTLAGRFFAGVGYEYPVSQLAGFLTFWTVIALFLLSGADAMGLPALSALIGEAITWLPPLAVAVLILLLGLGLARTARQTIEGVAERSRMVSARPLGVIVFYLVLSLAVAVALSGLGIDLTVITAVVVVVLGSAGVGGAVTLALGSRDVARNTISGIYARRDVRVGDRIRVGEVEGEVVAAGHVSLTLSDKSRTWLVPYDLLIGSVVEVLERAPRSRSREGV